MYFGYGPDMSTGGGSGFLSNLYDNNDKPAWKWWSNVVEHTSERLKGVPGLILVVAFTLIVVTLLILAIVYVMTLATAAQPFYIGSGRGNYGDSQANTREFQLNDHSYSSGTQVPEQAPGASISNWILNKRKDAQREMRKSLSRSKETMTSEDRLRGKLSGL